MSANNFLHIIKKKNPKTPAETFEIWNNDIESGKRGFKIGTANNLKGAYAVANIYMRENLVEYGIKIAKNCFDDK